jgi:Asp/Glu/hydantoin racemase
MTDRRPAKRIGMIHTVLGLAGMMDGLARARYPDIEVFHFVDEKLLADLLAHGLNESITQRMVRYGEMAQQAGADVILSTCSSTSPAVDVARKHVSVPFLKIDDAMARKAVSSGDRIGLFCTATSTVDPSRALLEDHAKQLGRNVRVDVKLEADAYKARLAGDQKKHDELVLAGATEFGRSVDVLVLAQASMAHLQDAVQAKLGKPVFASPKLCIEGLADWLN